MQRILTSRTRTSRIGRLLRAIGQDAQLCRSNPTFVHRLIVAGCFAFLSCTLGTGCCSTGYLALRTLVTEPYHFCFKVDRLRSMSIYRELAEQEWARVLESCGEAPLTPDYHAGFEEGFVQYVYAGGTGEAPPVPPREFWNVALRAENGKQRVNDWFEGYRHGSQVAAEGGYRYFGTVQSSIAGVESSDGLGASYSLGTSLENNLPATPAKPDIQLPSAPAGKAVTPSGSNLRPSEELPTPAPLDAAVEDIEMANPFRSPVGAGQEPEAGAEEFPVDGSGPQIGPVNDEGGGKAAARPSPSSGTATEHELDRTTFATLSPETCAEEPLKCSFVVIEPQAFNPRSYALANPVIASAAGLVFSRVAEDPDNVTEALCTPRICEAAIEECRAQDEQAANEAAGRGGAASFSPDASRRSIVEQSEPVIDRPTAAETENDGTRGAISPAHIPVDGNARTIYRASFFTR